MEEEILCDVAVDLCISIGLEKPAEHPNAKSSAGDERGGNR